HSHRHGWIALLGRHANELILLQVRQFARLAIEEHLGVKRKGVGVLLASRGRSHRELVRLNADDTARVGVLVRLGKRGGERVQQYGQGEEWQHATHSRLLYRAGPPGLLPTSDRPR